MPFKKLDAQTRPPRQWALVGYRAQAKHVCGADARPLLVIDSDHRFAEVAGLAATDVYELSENPVDHVDPRRIAELLRQNMGGAGVRTVVIDSLTAIIAPITTQAVMANDAGENKNRIAAFRTRRWRCGCSRTPSRAGAATRRGSTITATPETARRRRSRRPRSPPWSSPAWRAAA